MRERHAALLGEQLANQIHGRPRPGRAVGRQRGFAACQLKKFGKGMSLAVGADGHGKAGAHHRTDTCEVPQGIVGQLGINMRGQGEAAGRCHHQRAAVGRCLGQRFGGDTACGPGAILDDHGVATAAQTITHHARHGVRATAGCEADQQA